MKALPCIWTIALSMPEATQPEDGKEVEPLLKTLMASNVTESRIIQDEFNDGRQHSAHEAQNRCRP